jgi:hypothetical protein
MTDRTITFEWLSETGSGNALSEVTDAIDAASDQDQTTWIVLGISGKRIAKIAPVDEIPDEVLERVRDRLTADGAAWRRDPLNRDLLLQVIARQVEEIHRTLGLERDEEGDLMDGDPLDPPWYGKRGEVAARLTSGDLIMINRDLLLQVLYDAGLIAPGPGPGAGKGHAVWEALHALASAPVPRPPEPVPFSPLNQGKFTPSGPVTIQILVDVLSLAGVTVSMGAMAMWTYGQRIDAYDWAIREHLAASDNNDVARAERPAFLPAEWS